MTNVSLWIAAGMCLSKANIPCKDGAVLTSLAEIDLKLGLLGVLFLPKFECATLSTVLNNLTLSIHF